jgi:cytoskeletal protein CcmA (bactofilin family)
MAELQDGGTIIGADTVIKGEMTAESRAKILGRFEGTIKAKGQIEVADKAACQADVQAKVVQIDGGMNGNILASEKVQLNASAQMKGDVTAPKLVVADGACVDGHFKIGPDAAKKGPLPTGPSSVVGGPQSPKEPRDLPGGPKK